MEGVWTSLTDVTDAWGADVVIEPSIDRAVADRSYRRWLDAVDRSRDWAEHDPTEDDLSVES